MASNGHDSREGSSDEVTRDGGAEIDAMLASIFEGMEEQRGQVVIKNDDVSPLAAVKAAVLSIITDEEARVSASADAMERRMARINTATFLTLLAEREGEAVVFEGSLLECDKVFYELTRGGADSSWFQALAQVEPLHLQALFARAFVEGDLDLEEANEEFAENGEEPVPPMMIEYLAEHLPRPQLDVEVRAL